MASSSLPRGVVWGASNSPPLPPLVIGKFQDFRYPESRTHSNDRDSRSRQGISSARASTREPGIRRWLVPAINPIHRSRLERRDEFSSSPTTTGIATRAKPFPRLEHQRESGVQGVANPHTRSIHRASTRESRRDFLFYNDDPALKKNGQTAFERWLVRTPLFG